MMHGPMNIKIHMSPLNEVLARRGDPCPTAQNKLSQHSTPGQRPQADDRRPTSYTELPPGSANTHIYE
jgi:hypothetical protein